MGVAVEVATSSGASHGDTEGGANKEGKSDISEEELAKILTEYMRPVFEAYNHQLGESRSATEFQISVDLMKNVFEFTWGPDFFKTSRPVLTRMYKEISLLFEMAEGQTDLKDLLMYHPTEAVSAKLCQVFFAIAMIEPESFMKNFKETRDIFRDQESRLDSHTGKAYAFVLNTAKSLFEVLSGLKVQEDSQEPATALEKSVMSVDFNELSSESKAVVMGMKSRFVKWFRVCPKERYMMVKMAHEGNPASVEWVLYICQSLRASRREQVSFAVSKKPSFEELDYVDLSLKMEPNNPFVRLSVMECVVDAIREFNGRFKCGDHLNLVDLVSALDFLRKECESLCDAFPNNVHFKSVASDYFARYVPYLYFDKQFSGKLLQEVYEINPRNPKTTHRLGIFHRMNMNDMQESFKWLEKTLELDPTSFTATMDYFRILLGRPKEQPNVGERMAKILKDDTISGCWRRTEKAEFHFYTGLAYFASGEREETLKHWRETLLLAEKFFTLTDVDADTSFFKWDINRISAEKIRLWIHEEFDKIKGDDTTRASVNDSEEKERLQKKRFITRMFHLMFNIVSPMKPESFNGPYSEHFSHGLPVCVQTVLLPDRNKGKSITYPERK